MTEQTIIKKDEAEIVEQEPQSESAAVLSIIERAARDPSVDIDKLERLLEMRERIMDRDAVLAFNRAKAEAGAEMPQVVRRVNNTQTSSKYAPLEAISAAIDPIISKHGFSLSFGTGKAEREHCIRITCDLEHADGHSKSYHADIPIDDKEIKGSVNKTQTWAFGSTVSYGRRYLKCLIFDIALKGEDDDGNAAGRAPITDEQRQELQAAIDEAHADIVSFCTYFKIEALPDLPSIRFDEAMRMLSMKRQKGDKS